jgi:DNA end-binding protein Ku
MLRSGRCALAKWAARGKQHLVLIRATSQGLVLQQLLYADEVRSMAEIPVGEAEVKDAELTLAVQLVEQIASDQFRPEAYEDEAKKRTLEAIQRKVEGQEITAAPERPRAQVIDLMEALKASLAGRAATPAEEERKPARRAEAKAAQGPQRVVAGKRSRG